MTHAVRRLMIGLAVCALGAGTAAAQSTAKRGFVWDDRPSIVFGEDVHVDLRVKMAFDWRTFDPTLDEDRYDLNVLRFGLKGELTRHFDFEIERELSDEIEWTDWKDVYLNWDTFDAASVRGGRFKMPFGLEQNFGRTDLDFIYRVADLHAADAGARSRRDGVRARAGSRPELRVRGLQHRRRHRQARRAAVRHRRGHQARAHLRRRGYPARSCVRWSARMPRCAACDWASPTRTAACRKG